MKKLKNETEVQRRAAPVSKEAREPDTLTLGTWYHVKEWDWAVDGSQSVKKQVTRFRCLTDVGSNYAELTTPGGSDLRIHFDSFDKRCTIEPDADSVIKRKIEHWRKESLRLMDKVRDEAARLSLAPVGLNQGSETEALALHTGQPIKDYAKALVKAKDKTLPELFKEIEEANEEMAYWMKSQLVPLKAMVGQLEPVMEAIKGRIFNVELYAGLVESVEQIADGRPADLIEPVRIFQRRAYMDEECLAQYQTGGMEFENIGEFDEWVARIENRDRLLPFQRCIVAFQVRRTEKDRSDVNLGPYVKFHLKEADKATFLYIRNGDQLFRLQTGIEFGEQLFPDIAAADLQTGKVYAERFGGSVQSIWTEHQREGMREQQQRDIAEAERALAAAKASKDPDETAKQRKGRLDHLQWLVDRAKQEKDWERWECWTRESVYYDDITRFVQQEIERHNRLVLVLQGLFDRSPVMHPHPPSWKLWTPEGFAAALRLVYDDSRALTPGEAPDFEAYRSRLNASLRTGSVTVGQEDVWMEHEAVKENDRQRRAYARYPSDYKRYKPYGDPGPGTVQRCVRYINGSKKASTNGGSSGSATAGAIAIRGARAGSPCPPLGS